MKDVAVILAAAGASTRFNDPHFKKVFTLLSGRAVWQHSADVFSDHPRIGQVIVVISPEDREMFREKYGASLAMMGIEMALGGAQRWQSVQNALEKVRDDMKWVAVHDAARPCITSKWIDQVLEAAVPTGAAILASPIYGTIKRSDGQGMISDTVSRDNLWQAQTPQVFRKETLTKAFAQRGSLQPTDEAQLVEQSGVKVKLVEGSPLNIKITCKEDLRFAELAMKALPQSRGFPFL